MRPAKILAVVFLLSVVYSISILSVASADEEMSRIGFVKNDGSNVRAGDNINFEILCRMKKGDPVKITGKRYSWFKIALPSAAHLYIKNDYVDISVKKGTGTVNATHVNLRAGPATKYSILGQVSEPEELIILSEIDGWYEIEPPKGISGWIDSSQLVFDMELVEESLHKKKTVSKVAGEEKKKDLTLKDAPSETQKHDTTSIILKKGVPEPKGNLVFSTQGN